MSNTTSESEDQSALVVDGRVVERRGECESCGKKLVQRQAGRTRRYCNDRCRQAAHRDRHSVTR
jgi:hypothetical protein